MDDHWVYLPFLELMCHLFVNFFLTLPHIFSALEEVKFFLFAMHTLGTVLWVICFDCADVDLVGTNRM